MQLLEIAMVCGLTHMFHQHSMREGEEEMTSRQFRDVNTKP